MDSKLQDISNGTKNTQIGVRMTKLWPYEVGAKTVDCSNVATLRTNVATLRTNVATLRTNVATLQKQSIPCRDVVARRRDVRGRFRVDF